MTLSKNYPTNFSVMPKYAQIGALNETFVGSSFFPRQNVLHTMTKDMEVIFLSVALTKI